MASKEKWGIGMGSLSTFNDALLQNDRFVNNKNALWFQFILEIHG